MQILKFHKHSQLVQVGNVKLFPIKLKSVCSLYMLKIKTGHDRGGKGWGEKSTAETVIKTGYVRGVEYESWKAEQDSSVGKVFVPQS